MNSIPRSRALIQAAAILTVGLVLAAVAAIWLLRQDTISDVEHEDHRLGVVLAEQTARTIKAADLVLQEIAEKIADGGVHDLESLHDLFGSRDVHDALVKRLIDMPQAEAFTIVDATGHLVNASRQWPVPDYSVSYQAYFRHLASTAGSGPYISAPGISHSSGAQRVFLARRLTGPDGIFLGAVVAPIRLDYFDAFFVKTGLGDGAGVTILRNDGVVLVRYPTPRGASYEHISPNVKWYETVASGGGHFRALGAFSDLVPIFVSVHPLINYPIVVDVSRTESAAFARWWRQAFAIGLAAFLVSGGLTSLLRALCRQITLIEQSQERISQQVATIQISEGQLAAQSAVLQIALDSINQGLIMVDEAGAVAVCNRRAQEILGLSADMMEARPRYADLIAFQTTRINAAGLTGAQIELDLLLSNQATYEVRRPDGSVVEIRVVVLPGGGLVRTYTDITERKRLDEALRQSRERLAVATESARIGIWDWDVVADKLIWDARMYELYGIREEDFSGAYEAWQAGLHPDDRARGHAAIAAAIDRVADFNIEFRVVWPNGEVHDIEAHASVQAGADGRTTRMIGVNWDITERERAMETIRHQADQYTAMLATTSDGFYLIDRSGQFLAVNDAWCLMIGYSRDELLRMTLHDTKAPTCVEKTNRHMAMVAGIGFGRFESQYLTKDGVVVDGEVSVSFLRDTGGFLCFVRDITDRKQAEQALADSEARLKTVLDTNADGIVMVDAETTKFSFANRAFCDLLGYGSDEVTAIGLADVYPPETLPEVWTSFERLLRGETRVATNLPTKRKDGAIVFVDLGGSPMTLSGRNYLVGCFHNVTERKLAEEQIARMARHDSLTGLANRRVFVEMLEQTITRARRSGTSFAILCLDLDHFKDVNDTLGHPAGDVLLQTVAARLRANVREVDTVARFGGDEFAIILNSVDEPVSVASVSGRLLDVISQGITFEAEVAADAASVADRIVNAMIEPILIQADRIHSGATIGIAIYGPDFPDAETMLSRADVALYRAKAEERGTYRIFTEGMDAEVRARVSMSAELREAIVSNQLFLLYQPQYDINICRIVGLEALVRWNHPTLGVLGPSQFIPGAEKNGLIVPLGRWVMDEACRQTSLWLKAGIAPPLIAINLSSIQFKRPLELERAISAAVVKSGVPPRLLELELTESVLMQASRDHNDVLLRLRNAGHRIAIDDFGSGYSSLDYLRRYPVDRIKIAQTFIADIGIEPGNDAIVRAALGLARELNIEVVVEGVETSAQIDLLKAWGGRIVQGYYFARPLPVPEVTALLRSDEAVPEFDRATQIAAD